MKVEYSVSKLISDANKGNTTAQFNLANCYLHGNGVIPDAKQAIIWYTKAATHGHAKSQYELANCYFNGTGVPKSVLKAYIWYQKAAELGHIEARSMCLQISSSNALDEYKDKPINPSFAPKESQNSSSSYNGGSTHLLLLAFIIAVVCYVFFMKR